MPRLFHKPFAKVIVLNLCLVLGGLALAGCSSREQRAKDYYDQGMSYLTKQDFPKARIELRNALQQKGDMLEAWQALAQVDEHDKNFKSLVDTLRHVTELDEKDAKSRVKLAKIYLLAGNVDQALKVTNEAVQLEPQNTSVLALKAAVLYRLKDVQGAILEAQKALKIDPHDLDANVVVAAEKVVQGDDSGALEALANIATAHKNDLGVLALKANIYNRMGDLQQVEATLRQLIASRPKDPGFRNTLIQFLLAHKRPDDAEKELRDVIAADANDTNAEMQLVYVLGALKGPAAARAELVARIAAGGQVFPYQIALARLDFAQGNVTESTSLLNKLIDSSKATNDINTARALLAEMYLSKNNAAAAEPLIADILSADNRNIDALRLRSSIRLNRGQMDDAISDLRSALNDQPSSPVLLANLAIAYERSGSIELADKSFLAAMRTSNFAPLFGLNYVAFLQRRGLSDQAENTLVELAGHNPRNIAVLTALAKVKLARQDWVGAHQIGDTIRRLSDSKDLASDEINAAAFSGEQKFGESLELLQDAYNNSSGAAQPMIALVDGYLRAKQVDKAESFLLAALKANPGNAEALVLLGSIQVTKNDSKKAISYFEAAIKQQPKNPVGYQALASAYARENKIDDAINTIRMGLQQQPQDFSLRFTLAGMLEVKGQFEAAIAEYEVLLKDQPGSMIVANNLASLLTDHRTDKASIERASSLAQLLKDSRVPQFKDTLGWVNYQHGDYAAAVSALEDAAAKLPNIALIHYHLGMSYLAIGQQLNASEQFSKARQLAPNDAALKAKIDAALQNPPEKGKS